MDRRSTTNAAVGVSGPTKLGQGSRYGEYDYLLRRVDSWSMLDLDDLMLEIETDKGLQAEERKELLSRVYEILWRRAQKEM